MVRSVKIGPIEYAVELVKGLSREDGDKLDGRISHNQTTISLEENMSHQARTQVLLHEIIHAVDMQLGKQTLKEDYVDGLSFSLYQVLRDNPELVAMITEKGKERKTHKPQSWKRS